MANMIATPISLAVAKVYIASYHRHHPPPVGHKFSLAALKNGKLVGVVVVGRPSSRALDARGYLEVTRSCVDGTRNANSFLYAAAYRESVKRGHSIIITYTQSGESGASLRAAGYRVDAILAPRKGWDCPSRPRNGNSNDNITRIRWIKDCNSATKSNSEPAAK